MGIIAAIVMRLCYSTINASRAEVCAGDVVFDEAELSAQGDRAPTFRYML